MEFDHLDHLSIKNVGFEHQLEIPIKKNVWMAYIGLILMVGTSNLGSWNDHWWNVNFGFEHIWTSRKYDLSIKNGDWIIK